MIVYPLKSRLFESGVTLADLFFAALAKSRLRIRDRDIIAVTSKLVAISEGATLDLAGVRATSRAKDLARRYSLTPSFAQAIMDEADEVVGGVTGALLTIKDGDAVANAGVDRKNAPGNSVVLWPRDPDGSARRLRQSIYRKYHRGVGVAIVDSRVTPLRLGTIGLAIGSAGFAPVKDFRGAKDLFGRPAEITVQAIADGVAAASQLVMGETVERTPFALVRGAPVQWNGGKGIGSAKLPRKYCLYMSQIR